jgi:hypothetical protein
VFALPPYSTVSLIKLQHHQSWVWQLNAFRLESTTVDVTPATHVFPSFAIPAELFTRQDRVTSTPVFRSQCSASLSFTLHLVSRFLMYTFKVVIGSTPPVQPEPTQPPLLSKSASASTPRGTCPPISTRSQRLVRVKGSQMMVKTSSCQVSHSHSDEAFKN